MPFFPYRVEVSSRRYICRRSPTSVKTFCFAQYVATGTTGVTGCILHWLRAEHDERSLDLVRKQVSRYKLGRMSARIILHRQRQRHRHCHRHRHRHCHRHRHRHRRCPRTDVVHTFCSAIYSARAATNPADTPTRDAFDEHWTKWRATLLRDSDATAPCLPPHHVARRYSSGCAGVRRGCGSTADPARHTRRWLADVTLRRDEVRWGRTNRFLYVHHASLGPRNDATANISRR